MNTYHSRHLSWYEKLLASTVNLLCMENSWLICDLMLSMLRILIHFTTLFHQPSLAGKSWKTQRTLAKEPEILNDWNCSFLPHLPSHFSWLISHSLIHTCIMAQAMLAWICCYYFQSIYIVLIFNGDLNYCLFLRWLLKWLWQQWCRVYLAEQIRWKLVWICRSWAEWHLPAWVFSLHWAQHTYAMFR